MDFNAQVRPGELDCETQGTCSSCEIAIELTRKENVIRKMKRDRDQARDELEVANQRIVNLETEVDESKKSAKESMMRYRQAASINEQSTSELVRDAQKHHQELEAMRNELKKARADMIQMRIDGTAQLKEYQRKCKSKNEEVLKQNEKLKAELAQAKLKRSASRLRNSAVCAAPNAKYSKFELDANNQ